MTCTAQSTERKYNPVALISSNGETFELYPDGGIGRPQFGMAPHSDWLVIGAVEIDANRKYLRIFALEDILKDRVPWTHADGTARCVLQDLKDKKKRTWRGTQHVTLRLSLSL